MAQTPEPVSHSFNKRVEQWKKIPPQDNDNSDAVCLTMNM